MCGIAGFFNVSNIEFEAQSLVLDKMLDTLRRRGPNDRGVWKNGHVLFGHRRLAVIDVDNAKQPWRDFETGCVLSYNGEIYNFPQLKRALQGLGHRFVTHSDTEVLLKAYLQWGLSCLDHLDGMFAFAIYDPRTDLLFMARDRMGVKPLFFYPHDAGLIFSSSIAALLQVPVVDRVVCKEAVSHYLTSMRTSLGHLSLIQNVFCLQPGEFLTMSSGNAYVVRCYWQYPVVKTADKEPVAFADAMMTVKQSVENAVHQQLISDVSVGCFLSGGIDSAIISGLVKQDLPRCKTYNVGYDEEGFNEWAYVNQVAEFYGLDNKIEVLSADDYPADWLTLIADKGLPLSTPNEVCIYRLAQLLKRECTVAISGEGADEIFGGYSVPYFSAYDYDRSRLSSLTSRAESLTFQQSLLQMYGRAEFSGVLDHFFLLNSWIPFFTKTQLFLPDVWQMLDQDDVLLSYYERLFAQLDGCSTFDQYMHVHARINLEGLLFRVDSSTMAASVEARVPFTDHRLAEYVFTLPDSFKMDWRSEQAKVRGMQLNALAANQNDLFETKRLLRNAFITQLPEQIYARPKMSFPVPFMKWFGSIWQDYADRIICDSPLLGELFDIRQLAAHLKTPGDPSSAQILWPVCNLALWMNECAVHN